MELSAADVSETMDKLIRDVKGTELPEKRTASSGWMFTIGLDEFFKLSEQGQKNAKGIFLDILKPTLNCK